MDDRSKLSYVEALGATHYNPSYLQGNGENKQFSDDSVKSIFILESYIFGTTKPNKGNNKITELRTILQRESQNS